MDIEFGHGAKNARKESWKTILLLSYQSLGVVYGDLSISPLYVFKSTFADDITHSDTNEEIYGVLSFVFWSLTLIPLIKHADVSLLPNKQLSDEELSTYKVECTSEVKEKSKINGLLEKHKNLHTALLLVVMLGTCMVIGDGVLAPALSVFSAVSGLEFSISKEHHEYAIVPITCFLIVCLFGLQHFGTHRIGFLFAPIIVSWLLCIATLGLYNILHWNPHVYQAISPYYMIKFLKKTKKGGWMSLGGILLCMTGSEAMFADLGHFSNITIQIAFTSVVYPALVLGYMGQAAYLSKHHVMGNVYKIGFFATVPDSVRWPVLIIAILAAVVGSQSIISGTFSIINQSQSLGCFPRVKVVHTSDETHGQIYIPEINWILMILCLAVALGFRDTKHMGNASGLAVITVMLVTTCLTSLVIVLCWNKPYILALSFLLFFGLIETLYLTASIIKFREGAWVPILLAFLLMTVMFLWHYATKKKYEFDLQNKVSLDWLLALGQNLGVARVPGIGLVYTDLISGVPANFSHFITNLPAFHRVVVFVCVKYIPVPFVPSAERYLVGRVGPPGHRCYRCIVRYGYRDVHQDVDSFESELVNSLVDFVKVENAYNRVDDGLTVVGRTRSQCLSDEIVEEEPRGKKKVRFVLEDEREVRMDRRVKEELEEIQEACEAGTAFILGHSHVQVKPGSSIVKKLAVEVGYNFLKRNCRGPDVALRVPPASLLEVGMIYVL